MNFALAKATHAQSLSGLPGGSGTGWSLTLADTMDAAEAPWRALLSQDCFATPYQDFDFCALWLDHVGSRAGFRPCIVVGRDHTGAPIFVWPLVQRSVGGCRTASFFGGRHANLGTTLWRADIAPIVTPPALRLVLRQLAEAGVDALALDNQPTQVRGIANPLRMLPHRASPDRSYSLTIEGSGEEILARRYNADTRRKLRRKERRLAQLPGYRYLRIDNPEQADRAVHEFLRQKAASLAARGIANAFDEPGIDVFLREACRLGLAQGRPLIEIHTLETDAGILALFAGIHDRYCFSTMFNSYSIGEHARLSPGLALLSRLVEDCAQRGFETLNLGVGAAEYKSALCDKIEQPFDSVIGLTARGHAFALTTKAMRAAKSAIKNNPRLWTLVSRTRSALFARK